MQARSLPICLRVHVVIRRGVAHRNRNELSKKGLWPGSAGPGGPGISILIAMKQSQR
jgi:hypothetical protein